MRKDLLSPVKLSQFINNIKNHSEFGSAYVYHRLLPRVEAAYGPDLDLPADISHILKQQGIEKLFKHQVEAIEYTRQKENVLVATPTASGKSLIYNLTVLESLLQNENKKALYLFPLKALEQDQLKNLSVFLKGIKQKKITASIYDGGYDRV